MLTTDVAVSLCLFTNLLRKMEVQMTCYTDLVLIKKCLDQAGLYAMGNLILYFSTIFKLNLSFLLFSILQTVFGEIQNSLVEVPEYEREIFKFEDGGQVALDWVFDEHRTKGIVTILPGCTGDQTAFYVVNAVNAAVESGYNVVVTNHIGCAGVEVTSARLYCPASSWDYREIAGYIRSKYPNDKIFAIGYSLGANVLGKYLGEDGDKSLVTAAVCVSSPLDLKEFTDYLYDNYFGFFSKFLANIIKNKILEHKVQLQPLAKKLGMDIDKCAEKIVYLKDIDTVFSTPAFEYGTLENYYAKCSSSSLLPNFHTKTLFISAIDDPVCLNTETTIKRFNINENVFVLATHAGGHCASFESIFSSKQWVTKPTLKFFDHFLKSD